MSSSSQLFIKKRTNLMKNSIKILFTTAIILALSLFVYSCIKDTNVKTQETQEKVTIEQLRTYLIAKGYQMIASDRSGGCEPKQDPNGDCITLHESKKVSVPAYGGNPACDNVQISYDLLLCLDPNGQFSSSISNFNALPLGCDALNNHWATLNNQNLEIALDRFFYKASLDAEVALFSELAQQFNLNCPNYRIQSTFSTDLCFQYCVKFKPLSVTKNLCGRRCCIRTRAFCLNADGTVDFSAPEFSEAGDTCGDDPIPLSKECNGKKFGGCMRTCGAK
jgi:hypothetical protein